MYVSKLLSKWKSICWDKQGNSLKKKEVTTDILIRKLNNRDRPIWSYLLKGCFLEDMNFTDLGSDNGSSVTSIVLSYDYFEEPFSDFR